MDQDDFDAFTERMFSPDCVDYEPRNFLETHRDPNWWIEVMSQLNYDIREVEECALWVLEQIDCDSAVALVIANKTHAWESWGKPVPKYPSIGVEVAKAIAKRDASRPFGHSRASAPAFSLQSGIYGVSRAHMLKSMATLVPTRNSLTGGSEIIPIPWNFLKQRPTGPTESTRDGAIMVDEFSVTWCP